AHHVRAGDQPADREGAWHHRPPFAAAAGGPRNPVTVLDQRGQLLRAAVGFAAVSMPSYDRALWALRTWLDSWSATAHVTAGMAHQGYDLQLTRSDERGWQATFYATGMEHSPTSATGTAWERTPWHATQRAAIRRMLPRSRTPRRAPAPRRPLGEEEE